MIEVGDFFGCGVDVDFYMLRLFVRGDKCGVGLFFGMIYFWDDLIVLWDYWEVVVFC